LQEQDDVLGARLLVVPLGDLRFPDPLGDSPLGEQDTELLDRKQTGGSGRDEIADEVRPPLGRGGDRHPF
jgi:hypothetical protein